MFEKRISDVINELEAIKISYGNLKVMIHTTGGNIEFVNEIFPINHFNGKDAECVAFIGD